MNFYPTFSPCPETHKPDDGIETLIAACRWRLSMGESPRDIIVDLEDRRDLNASYSQIYLAITAAQLL